MDDRRRLIQILQLSEPLENTLKTYSDKKPRGDNFSNIVDPNMISLSKNIALTKLASKGKNIKKQDSLKSNGSDEEKLLLREELEICLENLKNTVKYN